MVPTFVVLAILAGNPDRGRLAAACFPERTVLWSAWVRDESDRILGAVRAGQVVRVLRDRVGKSGELAEVEVVQPAALRGLVKRRSLLVFSREEVAADPGWAWWLKNSPLEILRSDGGAAWVRLADPHAEDDGADAGVAALCSALVGTPPSTLDRDSCHGAVVDDWEALPGRKVWWPDDLRLTDESGRKTVELPSYSDTRLLKIVGRRAQVEVTRWFDRTRYRGWTNAAGMREDSRRGGYGEGHMCCEGRLYLKGACFIELAVDAVFQPEGAGVPTVPLKNGTLVWSVACDAGTTDILWQWPSPDRDTFTFALRGRAIFPNAPDAGAK